MSDEITLPFVFVADGADPPPELAAFKSQHPDCVSFPATFVASEQPYREAEPTHDQPAPEQEWGPPPSRRRSPPQPASADPAAALRAFQRASAAHRDPVTALRALRDTPEAFEDLIYARGQRTGGGRGNADPSTQLLPVSAAQTSPVAATLTTPSTATVVSSPATPNGPRLQEPSEGKIVLA